MNGLNSLACARHDGYEGFGCSNMAVFYGSREGVRKDEKRAFETLDEECDAGEMAACRNLVILYEQARTVPQDYKRANEILYAQGTGVPADVGR